MLFPKVMILLDCLLAVLLSELLEIESCFAFLNERH